MKTIMVVFCMMAAFAADGVNGKECKGITFPDSIQIDGATLALNGLGLRQACDARCG